MKLCIECGSRLGLTSDHGFCGYICKIVHRARRRAIRRHTRNERLRRLVWEMLTFPNTSRGERGLSPPPPWGSS